MVLIFGILLWLLQLSNESTSALPQLYKHSNSWQVVSSSLQLGLSHRFNHLQSIAIHRNEKRLNAGKPLLIQNLSPQFFWTPPEYLLRMLREQGNGSLSQHFLSPSQVSTISGVESYQVQRDLMALAAYSNGQVKATEEGQLLFSYSRDWESRLLQRSLAYRAVALYRFIYPHAAYVYRASYGIMLIASLAIIFTAISVAASGKSSEKDNDRNSKDRDSRFSSRGSISGTIDLSFLFRFNFSLQQARPANEKYSILDSIFSFLFGDANPNKDFDMLLERKLARLIQQNEGVLIAEQLAPFLLQPTWLAGASSYSEQWVLPLLLRFNGEPLPVTKDGHILYRFPIPPAEMLASTEVRAGSTDSAALAVAPVAPAAEEALVFSKAPAGDVSLAGLLGVLNIIGIAELKKHIPVLVKIDPVYGLLLKRLYPFLAFYAFGYLATPLARALSLVWRNRGIRRRNEARQQFRERLAEPALELKEKLDARKEAAVRVSSSAAAAKGSDRVIFDSADSDAIR